MTFAPVLIPTLCRYDKFVRCFESLNENTWAEFTDLVVALDYPKKPSHKEGYQKIKEYCESIIKDESSKFKSFTLICRSRNLGAIGNFERLVKQTFQKYDRCICTFDDIEHSKNFIQYMDEMLDSFKEDKNVCMVTGYSYPVAWEIQENCNVVKQNLEGSIWGVGFWKDKWFEMTDYLRSGQLIRQFPSALTSGKLEVMTDWAVKDYVKAVVNGAAINSLLKRATDIALRIYLSVADKYAVMPVVSKTRNIGFDGSGAYCEEILFDAKKEATSSNYRFDLQPIDPNSCFFPKIDPVFDNTRNLQIVNSFDRRPAGEREELLAEAKEYSALSQFDRFSLNLKATSARATKKIKRLLKK